MSTQILINLIDTDYFPFEIDKNSFLYVVIFILIIILLFILFEPKITKFYRSKNIDPVKAIPLKIQVQDFIKKYHLDTMEENEAVAKLEELFNKREKKSCFFNEEFEIAKLLLEKDYLKKNNRSK